eukprot:CAMPEP_0183341814 /NCGR_PEP_ID=MMETSP0164_2-20130417/8029_1 /TAXON_ID=221442 /ORGANISM="Coccolithus pelagicus ssp braarudi, Strain PLY182g" /LENGTH=58 /DNA_ID=CAMNT_0025512237 /DNA_START=427 /DNA_END=599 /DNA_ORIENTATION=-
MCLEFTTGAVSTASGRNQFAVLALELLVGMRVGEATSAGDLHGLAANDLCFSSPGARV